MRVGIDALILSDPLTGIGHYTFQLARHLALDKPGDEYILITTRPLSPTIFAISLVTEPDPHPISMQLMPFFRPAFKSICFVRGSNKFA